MLRPLKGKVFTGKFKFEMVNPLLASDAYNLSFWYFELLYFFLKILLFSFTLTTAIPNWFIFKK